MEGIINRLGYDCEIIDFIIDDVDNYSLLNVRLKDILNIPYYNILRYINFGFFRKHMLLSNKCKDNEGLLIACEKYDACVVGSDQVWNKRFNRIGQNFFLKGYKRKIAFAASIGSTTLEILRIYEEEIKEFSDIYVREYDALDKLKAIVPNLKIECVLDPTLLFSKKSWYQLAKKRTVMFEKKNYVLCYWMSKKDLPNYIYAYARERKLDIVYISYFNKGKKEFIDGSSFGPLEFLSAYMHANIVFTNSFHGTAFSIIFEKQFFLVETIDMPIDDRKLSLLRSLGINDRVILKNKATIHVNMIDYNQVNRVLSSRRKKDLFLLKKSLQKF